MCCKSSQVNACCVNNDVHFALQPIEVSRYLFLPATTNDQMESLGYVTRVSAQCSACAIRRNPHVPDEQVTCVLHFRLTQRARACALQALVKVEVLAVL